MKKASFKIGALIGALMLSSSQAMAGSASGNIGLNFSGFLRTQISSGGRVTCSATAFMVPDTTNGSLNISALSASILTNSALSSSQWVAATVQTDKQTFTCSVIVPYLFNNVVTGQKLAVTWTVAVQDDFYVSPTINGGFQILPGSGSRKTKQIIPNLDPAAPTVPLIQVYL
jgi:hypothetical protein